MSALHSGLFVLFIQLIGHPYRIDVSVVLFGRQDLLNGCTGQKKLWESCATNSSISPRLFSMVVAILISSFRILGKIRCIHQNSGLLVHDTLDSWFCSVQPLLPSYPQLLYPILEYWSLPIFHSFRSLEPFMVDVGLLTRLVMLVMSPGCDKQ